MSRVYTQNQRGITGVGFVAIAVVVIVFGALVVWQWQRDTTPGNEANTANQSAIQNARCDYTDTDLCKFFAVQKINKRYSLASTQEVSGQKSDITLKKEGDSKYHLKITGAGAKEIISIDTTLYTKSADGTWIKQTLPKAEANKNIEPIAPSLPEATKNVDPGKVSYKKVGSERCDNTNCLKYQVHHPAAPKTTTFIWFDTADYSLRRMQAMSEGLSTNTTFSYGAITVAAPSDRDIAKNPAPSPNTTAVQGQATTLPQTGDD